MGIFLFYIKMKKLDNIVYISVLCLLVAGLTGASLFVVVKLFGDDDKEFKTDAAMKNKVDTVLVLGTGMHNTSYDTPLVSFTGVTKDGRDVYYNYPCDGKHIVNVGDTLVMDLSKAKKRIVENITQNRIRNNFVKQK